MKIGLSQLKEKTRSELLSKNKEKIKKFVIDLNKLTEQNILSIKYSFNNITAKDFPNMQVSENVKKVLLSDKIQNKNLKLTDSEKNYLIKFYTRSEVKIPPSKEKLLKNVSKDKIDICNSIKVHYSSIPEMQNRLQIF